MRLDARLIDLVSRYEEAREQGQPLAPEELCRDCPELLSDLKRNLRGLGEVDQMLGTADEPSACRTVAAAAAEVRGGRWRLPEVTGYELLEELGAGGMGVVYRARQLKLNRLVALKMILAGARATPAERQRFRQEAETVARLRHPNIVQIHELGEQDDTPYLALEYVNGGSLARRLNGTPLPPRAAAALIQTLAQAVHAAHQQGIIHRDLKPSNILLQIEDSGEWTEQATPQGTSQPAPSPLQSAVPKIADFGLAKRLDLSAGQTRTDDLLGTPSYMAPEQAAGRSKEVGPAADTYALGAILYECLTGRPPHRGDSHYEIVRRVLDDEPTPVSRLRPGIPRDLDIICLKCLQKDPRRRYASALELADDLRRHLAGEPILARRAGLWERGVKAVQRRPAAALAALAAVSLLACAGAVGYTLVLRNALGRLRTAEAEIRLSQQDHAYAQNVRSAGLFWRNGDVGKMREMLALQQTPEAGGPRLCGFAWGYLRNLCRDCNAAALRGHEGAVHAAAFSPDGRHLATAGQDGTVRLWDPRGWQCVRTLRGHDGAVHWVGFLDDKTLLTAGRDRTLRSWDVAAGQEVKQRPAFDRVPYSLCLSRDRRRLAAALPGRQVGVLELTDGSGPPALASLPGEIETLAFTADGRQVAALSATGIWYLLEAGTDRRVGEQWGTEAGCLAWSHEGRLLALTGAKGRVVLKTFTGGVDGGRLQTGEAGTRACREYHGPLRHPVFSPDDRLLAVAADDDTVRLLDLRDGGEQVLRGHEDRITGLVFAPDGQTLVSASRDGTARRWAVAARQEAGTVQTDVEAAGPLAFSPDGSVLAVVSRDRTVKLVEPANKRIRATLCGHKGDILALAFSTDGQLLATASRDRTARVWRTADGQPLAVLTDHPDAVEAVAFAPDGRTLASGSRDGLVRFWDVAAGKVTHTLAAPAAVVISLAFSGDGTLLAAACEGDKRVRVWDVALRRERHDLGHDHPANVVAFAHCGDTLAAGQGASNNVAVWDAATGERLGAVVGVGSELRFLAFAADDGLCFGGDYESLQWFDTRTHLVQKSVRTYERRPTHAALHPVTHQVAFRGTDGLVRLLSPADWSGRLLAGQAPVAVRSLSFTPDGQTLATGGVGREGTVRREFFTKIDCLPVWDVADGLRLWDAKTGAPRPPFTPDRSVAGFPVVAHAPDGRLVAAGSEEGSVWVWDRETGKVQHRFRVGRRAHLLGPLAESIVTYNPFWLGGNLGPNWEAGQIRALAFAPGGKVLAAASGDGVVKLLDPHAGREIATLPEEHDDVACLAFSPDGRLLAVNHRHRVRLWDVAAVRVVHELVGHRDRVWAVAFRPDGALLATGGQDARIWLWDPADGRQLEPLVGHQDTVAGLAFSPRDGGRTLASGGWDGQVKLWNLATQTELLTLEAHAGRVNALAFAPDGSVLATGGETPSGAGEVFLWRARHP